jgi:hypothetical protein
VRFEGWVDVIAQNPVDFEHLIAKCRVQIEKVQPTDVTSIENLLKRKCL